MFQQLHAIISKFEVHDPGKSNHVERKNKDH